jgi:hypothetical protein
MSHPTQHCCMGVTVNISIHLKLNKFVRVITFPFSFTEVFFFFLYEKCGLD